VLSLTGTSLRFFTRPTLIYSGELG
jgi:hypothetical protein